MLELRLDVGSRKGECAEAAKSWEGCRALIIAYICLYITVCTASPSAFSAIVLTKGYWGNLFDQGNVERTSVRTPLGYCLYAFNSQHDGHPLCLLELTQLLLR